MLRKIFHSFVILIIAAAVFLIGAKLVDWMTKSPAFSLHDVQVKGNRLVSTAEILKMIPVQQGQNLTSIDLAEIQKAIEKHPYIETALVSRRFPSALQIEIGERIPVALISGSNLFAIDETGILLPRLASVVLTGLPVITGIDGFREQIGQKISSDRIAQAIDLFNLARSVDSELYQNLSEVHFDSRKGFTVYFSDARFPAYFGFDDFYEKAQKLQAFFLRVKEENRYQSIKYVDLRFQNQVVAKFN